MSSYGLVALVEPGSRAEAAGIVPGDTITTMGGHPLTDVLDYRFMASGERVEMTLRRASREEVHLEILKGPDEDLGLELEGTGLESIRVCRNRCTFCFVDQLPRDARPSLKVKDDDYVHSFLNGNYVSLTNCSDEDIHRIIRLRLTPVFVSVHTTSPELRVSMMRNPRAARIMDMLTVLTSGVEVHTQLVLVPGVNDGDELDRSLRDLLGLGPNLASVAVVPVGLTKHREGLDSLRVYSPDEACDVVSRVEAFQMEAIPSRGARFVYASDEFYLKAGLAVPADPAYDDYPQLDNGVGLVRQFLDGFAEAVEERLPGYMASGRPKVIATVVTGASAAPILAGAAASLPLDAFDVRVVAVENRFFGETVTVAGLMTGGDIANALRGTDSGQFVVVPDVCLREDDGVFLDGMALSELQSQLSVPVVVAESTGSGLLKALIGGARPARVPRVLRRSRGRG